MLDNFSKFFTTSFLSYFVSFTNKRETSVDRVAEIRANTRLDVTNDKKRAILCKQRNWSNSPRRETPPIATKKHGLQLNWIGYGPNKTLVDGLCRVCRSLWREIKLHVRCRLGHAVRERYSFYLKPSSMVIALTWLADAIHFIRRWCWACNRFSFRKDVVRVVRSKLNIPSLT